MPEESEDVWFINRLRRDWWLFLLALAIPMSVVGSWYLSTLTEYPFTEWIRIVSLIGSLVLSLVLAFLYQGFKDIQGQQSEVMRNQEKLMEADHKPELELDQVEATSSKLICYLSNVGKGTASELQADIKANPLPESDLDFELFEETVELTRYNNLSDNGNEGQIVKNSGSFLRPNESRVPMSLIPVVGYETESGGGTSLLTELPTTIGLSIDDTLFDVEDESEIREEIFPNKENVEVIFKEGKRMWTSLHPNKKKYINNGDFGVKIQDDEDSEVTIPKKEILRKRVTDLLDFDALRVRINIRYSGPEIQDEKKLEVHDIVIPFGYEEDASIIFKSGIEYDRYDPEDSSHHLRWNVARRIADKKVSE